MPVVEVPMERYLGLEVELGCELLKRGKFGSVSYKIDLNNASSCSGSGKCSENCGPVFDGMESAYGSKTERAKAIR
jgi:hypothetical protein